VSFWVAAPGGGAARADHVVNSKNRLSNKKSQSEKEKPAYQHKKTT
jgi:hypothetical protein